MSEPENNDYEIHLSNIAINYFVILLSHYKSTKKGILYKNDKYTI